MDTGTRTIKQLIEDLLAKAAQQGFDITGNQDAQWFLVKMIKLGKPFNKAKSPLMVKFMADSRHPIILLSENLQLASSNRVCSRFLSSEAYVRGWKSLCPHMFQDVADDLLAFIGCLAGFLANPSLCGLMGCEGRAPARTEQ